MVQSVIKSESNLTDSEYRRAALSLHHLGLVRRVPDKQAIEFASVTHMPLSSAQLIGTTDFADDFLEICSSKQAG
jgi:hypothetical protein